jgi:hypothetical protein
MCSIRSRISRVIENVPTSEELRTVSLRLYFKAWADITEIVIEWLQLSEVRPISWSPEKGHYYVEPHNGRLVEGSSEWREYIQAAQSDLQGIYTLIQQSQEIGLKARICEVSPYLLLKRTDVKPAEAKHQYVGFHRLPHD